MMFSSTYDSNFFPNFPLSTYPILPFLIESENDFASHTLLVEDPLVVPLTHDPPPFPEETVANFAVADHHCTAMLDNQHDAAANTNYGSHYGSSISNFLTHQKPAAATAKKDRHSKIHTSQGLRDRRVRLSSEIARKFFDLQDMLEFDKPSNTLEWLFTKSENAIKELARSKHSGSVSTGGDKSSRDPSGDSNNNFNNNKSMVGGGVGDGSKGRKLKWAQRDDACIQNKKESRERARARARERTCFKKCSSIRVQQQKDFDERCPATTNTTQMLHQLWSSIQPEPEEPRARWVQPYYNPYFVDDNEAPRDHGFNVIEESIMIKRNMKPLSQPNLVIPREASFNNNEFPLLPYSTTPNWESTNGAVNYCGISTMNLSTCFMNPWVPCCLGHPASDSASEEEMRYKCSNSRLSTIVRQQ
ncbi:hypothetical protein JHK87_029037 [Glycine soja]|nr:hypothetical protein JHK87_029037 [Glycine soja]